MRKVIGIGETVLDIIFKNGQPICAVPGGSAFNAAISLGRCGIETRFISEAGNDRVGNEIINFLRANGVNADDVNVFPDSKIDIFLSETDYVNKYTDAEADVAIPLTTLGIDPNVDLANQYAFTKTTASDQNGVQRGSTWQCCPGLLVYRRDIALDAFGTDDPAEVGALCKDWATMESTAATLKARFTFC